MDLFTVGLRSYLLEVVNSLNAYFKLPLIHDLHWRKICRPSTTNNGRDDHTPYPNKEKLFLRMLKIIVRYIEKW